MTDFLIIVVAIFRYFVWIGSNILLGFIPLSVAMILNNMPLSSNGAETVTAEISNLRSPFMLSFFAVALMGSLVVDRVLEGNNFSRTSVLFEIILPILVAGVLVFTYFGILFNVIKQQQISDYIGLPKFVIFFSLFYCTLKKVYDYI